jgi:hypothetical protein
MLFTYTYVPHSMERMQEFIDFIYFEVWCKAPIGLKFSPDLFEDEPDLRAILSYFGFAAKAPKRGNRFYKEVQAIYELFAPLSPPQIDQLQQWYQANNDLEKACANDPAVQIARYADMKAIYPDLSAQLASFFKELYSKELLNLAALQEKIGNIDEHYKAFMQVNTTGKCPFCGITDMLGVYHTKREAYDHYLPKGLYPFNSINFKNLVPACHYCNSSYKTTYDPGYTPKDPTRARQRRKAFYPYSAARQSIDVKINFNTSDIDELVPNDIELSFGPAAAHEEIDTWMDVYSIDERYKAKCCSADAKDWLEQVRIFQDAYGIAPTASLATVQKQTTTAPFANNNFLKKAFLEGCQRRGIFDAQQKELATVSNAEDYGPRELNVTQNR